jgi:hypothetical protein
MPTKKRATPPEPPWQVILEEMRSQNRATIEAVEVSRVKLERRLEQLREQTNARLEVLEAGVRQNSTDIRHLQADVREVASKVDALTRIEDRVAALERRRA